MTKVIISKKKLENIESLLFAGFGAVIMNMCMQNNVSVDEGTLRIKDKVTNQIINILKNK